MRFFAGHVLLRYVDDFLFVATDAVAVKAFVDSMRTQAAILFGCRINEAKTRSNVPEVLMDDGSKDGTSALKDEMIRWCGFCISSKDLQVTADNSSYGAIEMSTSHGTSQVNTKKDTKNHTTRSTDSVVSVCSVPSRACCHPIADSMTIDYSAPWGQQLQQRLLRLLKNRLQLLLLDSRINSTNTVIGNILTAFQLTASRCWLHCKVSNPAFLNNDFLFDACCRRMALSCASWLRSKRQDQSNSNTGSAAKPSVGCCISQVICDHRLLQFLMAIAYLRVFGRKPTGFTQLLKRLKGIIRKYRSMFKQYIPSLPRLHFAL